MNFLVLGCNGMAGHMISLYLKEKGHNVIGFARKKSVFIDTVCGDVRDSDFLKRIIYKGNYDSVINCVGLLNQFAENNKSDAVLINAYLPHFLARITQKTDIQIIHMSTDCVFSGRDGRYTETSFKDGESFYDRTKALGEIEDDKNITLRNSIVGPDINENGIGLLNWFMMQKDQIFGFKGAIWTGQTTLQLAKTMEYAAKTRASGLYNTVPLDPINKYDLLNLFNRYLRKKPIVILPQNDYKIDKSLIRTRFNGLKYYIPDYETMIKELRDWMLTHKELYPHYDL